MIEGRVIAWNDVRAFGFVRPADGSVDIFLHISAVHRSGLGPVTRGQRIGFEVETDERGRVRVSRIIELLPERAPSRYAA